LPLASAGDGGESAPTGVRKSKPLKHSASTKDLPSEAPPPGLEGLVSSLIAGMVSEDMDEVGSSVMRLALLVDESEEAERVAMLLREGGGIPALVSLFDHPAPEVHQCALLVVGNLGTADVDSNAELTRALLKRAGAHALLPQHVFSNILLTVMYALAAIQNTCSFDTEFCESHDERSGGLMQRLRTLQSIGEPRVEQYATGCLVNMKQTAARAKRDELRAWATRERERVRTAGGARPTTSRRLTGSQSEAQLGLRARTADAEAWNPPRIGWGNGQCATSAATSSRTSAASPRLLHQTGAAERRSLTRVASLPALQILVEDHGPQIAAVGSAGGETQTAPLADGGTLQTAPLAEGGAPQAPGPSELTGEAEAETDELFEDACEEASGGGAEVDLKTEAKTEAKSKWGSEELSVELLVEALDEALGGPRQGGARVERAEVERASRTEPAAVAVHSKLPYQGLSSPHYSARRKVAPTPPAKLPVNERPFADVRQPRDFTPPPPKQSDWSVYPMGPTADRSLFGSRPSRIKSGSLVSRMA